MWRPRLMTWNDSANSPPDTTPGAALRIAADLVRRIEALRDAPLMGCVVGMAPDPESIRDMVFANYIVSYAVTARSMAVLRIWHHFQLRN
jgi:plasmid stabilization system protein ParE